MVLTPSTVRLLDALTTGATHVAGDRATFRKFVLQARTIAAIVAFFLQRTARLDQERTEVAFATNDFGEEKFMGFAGGRTNEDVVRIHVTDTTLLILEKLLATNARTASQVKTRTLMQSAQKSDLFMKCAIGRRMYATPLTWTSYMPPKIPTRVPIVKKMVRRIARHALEV